MGLKVLMIGGYPLEPGVVYVSGTRVIFSGGSTPTVTAPSTNPHIDVLTIDSSGALRYVWLL